MPRTTGNTPAPLAYSSSPSWAQCRTRQTAKGREAYDMSMATAGPERGRSMGGSVIHTPFAGSKHSAELRHSRPSYPPQM
mmetsp:Transcript_29215/g.77177  ORF Transcript_29215/g.77177 Transcript_29215/m.77177 type:complete len:80 (-) Transcript_29215:1335-1574(-)